MSIEHTALGFAYGYACLALDRGEDPRDIDMAGLLQAWEKQRPGFCPYCGNPGGHLSTCPENPHAGTSNPHHDEYSRFDSNTGKRFTRVGRFDLHESVKFFAPGGEVLYGFVVESWIEKDNVIYRIEYFEDGEKRTLEREGFKIWKA